MTAHPHPPKSPNPSAVLPRRVALVMAGGTGGHIFPGLAVAEALRERGWQVHWLGAPASMEERLVPPRGFAFEPVQFGGLRGKGVGTLALAPLKLLRAFWQSWRVVRRVRPGVVLGLGGYITFPGGMMAVLAGKPLVLHEQNSIAGLANKVLAQVADRCFTAYPQALPAGEWVGNPLRTEFVQQPDPAQRFAGRTGPLRVLVLGGSLGAKGLNDVVPAALALLPPGERPLVRHQSGANHVEALRAAYAAAGVVAEVTPFIDDTAQAMADADLLVCRAGASTVTELAAVGAASVLVPFPHAVDDHQTHNARFLVDAGAATLVQQRDLSAALLASIFQKSERTSLLNQAQKAKNMQKTDAVNRMVTVCEQLAGVAS
ncbi:MAG: undecaprenyldiphospho-muramoylpentapeptide beta-N-acetylglucosaminyltransferase [Burkholderiaceae bacterium]|nr:undecaprenyldiphospho-muramoylpentapeptide beta-N-acetylglucosaminyltransferase [Burkholderiaceae bacterium]